MAFKKKNGNFDLLPFLQSILSLVFPILVKNTTIHTFQTTKEEPLWFPPFPLLFLIYHISKLCYISKMYLKKK